MIFRAHLTTPALLLLLAACGGIAPAASTPKDGTRARIAVLETTDLHSNVLSYDYFKLTEDKGIGIERTATLVRQARAEFPNTLLFDDGDTIQGTTLADWQALVAPVRCDSELAVYKAMDTLGYDAGTIGNHEFNYGLAFLSQVTGTAFHVAGVPVQKCKGPQFPLVLANVFSADDGKPLYQPWRILTRKIHAQAPDGTAREVTVRIGVLGLTPVGILQWDKRNLDGKVTVLGMVEAAQKYVPELRSAGADIVIALVHGGLDTSPYTAQTENAGWHVAGVPGIDAILLGHSHQIFPSPGDPKARYAHTPEVDNERGTVRGVPAVMANFYGKNLGVIDLAVVFHDGHWQVDRAASKSEVRSVKAGDGFVAPEAAIEPLVHAEHEGTVAYVKTPIGNADFVLNTYFVAVGDTSALQIVNAADRDYVETYIKSNVPELAGIPVLAAASPFKAGFGGPHDYTDVAAGPLAINNAADLYLYPNTVAAVKIDGAGVKAWLEQAATRFNRIDPVKTEPQQLINARVPTYNFDVIQGGLSYVIDVTRPERERIVELRYQGKPVDPAQPFIVVTNNYRAGGGGNFPGVDGSNIVVSAPDMNRDVLIAYIRSQHDITRERFGNDRNWRFAAVHVAGLVVFTSAAGKLELARAAGLSNVALVRENADGTAVYAVDLSR